MSSNYKFKNSLTDNDLKILCKELKLNINGIYCKDELPKELDEGWYIINLDSKKGEGTHWVCCCKNYFVESLYFDSFGMLPPVEVQKRLLPKFYFNADQIQETNSVLCGYYCIALIYFMTHHQYTNTVKSMKQFQAMFNDLNFVNRYQNNDLILKKYLSSVFYK